MLLDVVAAHDERFRLVDDSATTVLAPRVILVNAARKPLERVASLIDRVVPMLFNARHKASSLVGGPSCILYHTFRYKAGQLFTVGALVKVSGVIYEFGIEYPKTSLPQRFGGCFVYVRLY